MNKEDAQRVLRALEINRVMARDVNGDYTREITPKLITEAIAIMQTEVDALPIGMAGDEPSADAWQPIETAPKDGVPILVANHVRGGSWIAFYCPVNSHGCKLINPWQSLMLNTRWHKTPHATTAPTVWQPLPLPPVAASGIRAQESTQ